MTLETFKEKLRAAGWNSPCDAQGTRIAELWEELAREGITAPAPEQDTGEPPPAGPSRHRYHPFTAPFRYDPAGQFILDAHNNRVADIRGWGYLTGKGSGALGMSDDEAAKRFDEIGVQIATVMTAQSAKDALRATEGWRLYICDRETGKDYTHSVGDRTEILDRMELLASEGHDVWAMSPYGAKVLPVSASRSELERLESFLHSKQMHPDYEYTTVTGPRKGEYDDEPHGGEEAGWERNIDLASGFDRFDYDEENYWRRKKSNRPPGRVPNLDSDPEFQDPAKLIDYWSHIVRNANEVARGFFPHEPEGCVAATRLLGEYAKARGIAILLRAAGRIDAALEKEKECENIYGRLPDYAKW